MMNNIKQSSVTIMLTGIVTLIAVMGIGRFSLTPQIPIMIGDGFLTLSTAGILASMNYIGYLLGALHVSRMKSGHVGYLKAGLACTVLVTILSGFTSEFELQCLFRFVAGVGGAWALIIVTTWTQLSLATRQAPRLSAAVFTGPGLGITLSGLLAWCMSQYQLNSSQSWLIYGVVSLIAMVAIWRQLPAKLESVPATATKNKVSSSIKKLIIIYTLAGFGYILPATFLSQMAHSAFPGSQLSAFFWPLFGISAVTGVVLVILSQGKFDTRISLSLAMIFQGAGVSASVIIPGAPGLLISTILTGLGFLSIMQLTMRFARELTNGSLAGTVGLLTSGYATGQLTGPLISSLSLSLFGSLEEAILLASCCLIAGGLIVIGIKSRSLQAEVKIA